ncbi:MAG: hypothetical protein GY829_05115 [Gammaproteobacteria bacterium]|nr:hypothetical protein [Gammaproteobacteria bacterium]
MNEEKVKALLAKARNGKHKEVVEDYTNLSQAEKLDRLTMYAYADALYELGRDIESLKSYVEFANHYPNEKATNYALFGAAVSLKNLDLQKEALEVLRLIKSEHEGLKEEIEDCNKKIRLQFQAKTIFKSLSVAHQN